MLKQISHTVFIVFGSTGDLSVRKLFPSLYVLYKQNLLPENMTFVAFGRRSYSVNEYHAFLEKKISERYPDLIRKNSWEAFKSSIRYVQGSFECIDDFKKLGMVLREIDETNKVVSYKIFYMAISPDQYELVINGIKVLQKEKFCHKKLNKVVVEKPFGKDLRSFESLNKKILSVFEEKSVYRIDHYLGKDTIRNILYVRSLNPLLRNLCCDTFIKRIDVHAFEAIGVGNRGSYFDAFGQLKDMVQSHLLQVFALSTIELDKSIPETLISGKMPVLSKRKAEVISKLYVRDIVKDCIRAQYGSGVVEGKRVTGYRNEKDVSPNSQTETYVWIKAVLDLPAWRQTEINFRTGKALRQKQTEVVFYIGSPATENINVVKFRLQPNEGMSLSLYVKSPNDMALQPVELSFDYRSSFTSLLSDEYENILLDVIRSDRSSFISSEELVASWKFIDSITSEWITKTTLKTYPAGIDPLNI